MPVGQTIAWLLKAGESAPAASGATQQTGRKMDSAPAAAAAAAVEAAPDRASVAGAKISPKARRLAQEHGVDIARVRGSGPGGEILADDIMKAAAQQRGRRSGASAACRSRRGGAPARAERLSRLRDSARCRRSARSWPSARRRAGRTVPHFFVTRDVDAPTSTRRANRRVPRSSGRTA